MFNEEYSARDFQFHTPSACITLDKTMNKIDVITEDGQKTIFEDTAPKEPGRNVILEVKYFIDCIIHKKRPDTDGYEALRSHRIIWEMEIHPGRNVNVLKTENM